MPAWWPGGTPTPSAACGDPWEEPWAEPLALLPEAADDCGEGEASPELLPWDDGEEDDGPVPDGCPLEGCPAEDSPLADADAGDGDVAEESVDVPGEPCVDEAEPSGSTAGRTFITSLAVEV